MSDTANILIDQYFSKQHTFCSYNNHRLKNFMNIKIEIREKKLLCVLPKRHKVTFCFKSYAF